MKLFISIMAALTAITIALVLACAPAHSASCPPSGDGKTSTIQTLDRLKNRGPGGVGSIDSHVTLDAILALGDDTHRWNAAQGAQLTGYVVLVKSGGSETSNCHSKTDLDVHIELGLTPKAQKNAVMIVEITPQFQDKLGHVKDIKKFVGKKVTVTGAMFFDQEHWNNAANTGHAKNIWRGTAWEIHPVTSIELAH